MYLGTDPNSIIRSCLFMNSMMYLGTDPNSVLTETQTTRIPTHWIGLAGDDAQSQVEWNSC